MKLDELLMEMAKSKNKRQRAAKNAAKDKAKNPTLDATSNLVAKFAQRSGAGFHSEEGKGVKGKAERRDGKKQIKRELDN